MNIFDSWDEPQKQSSLFGVYDNEPFWDGNIPALEGVEDLLALLPVVKVEERDDIIRVSGFFARDIHRDFKKHWGTTRVANNIFIDLSMRSFTAHKFYVIEILYMLKAINDDPRSMTSPSTIRDISIALMDNTWLGKLKDAEEIPYDLNAVNRGINFKSLKSDGLLKNQEGFIKNYARETPKLNLRGSMMDSPPGTGKTISGFAFHFAFDMDITVYVVPKNSVEKVWESTCVNNLNKKHKYWISTSKDEPTGKEDFWFCHYEQLSRILDKASKIKGKRVGVWLDESHNFVEIDSARTLKFAEFCNSVDARFVIWASGTPLKARGSEVIPILLTIDPNFTWDIVPSFKAIFGATTVRAMDVLHNRIKQFSYKVKKSDIVQNTVREVTNKVTIPNSERFTLPVVARDMEIYLNEQLTYFKARRADYEERWNVWMSRITELVSGNEQDVRDFRIYRQYSMKMHNSFNHREDVDLMRFCKKFEKTVIEPKMVPGDRKDFRHIVAVYKYAILVARGRTLGNVMGKRRTECFVEIAKAVPYTKVVKSALSKSLIFTSFVPVAKTIIENLRADGHNPALVIGETNKDLKAILNKAENDPRVDCVVATFQSLSTAIPMIFCSTCWFNDDPFRDYIKEQALSRLDRYGQPHPITFGRNELDTGGIPNLAMRSQEIQAWSKAQVAAMLGNDFDDIDDSEI